MASDSRIAAAEDLARAGGRNAPVEIVAYDPADPVLAGGYVALKRALAERHRDDREAYTEAKSEFVKRHS